jgi:hypothetical protein
MQEGQGSIKVRFYQTGEEASVDVWTLYEWMESGKISEDDMLQGDLLTAGEWKRAGGTRMFWASRNFPPPPPPPQRQSYRPLPLRERYRALLIVSILSKALAVIVGVFTLVEVIYLIDLSNRVWQSLGELGSAAREAGLGAFGSPSGLTGIAIAGVLGRGAIIAVLLWAVGEVIPLFIEMAENTRRLVSAAAHDENTTRARGSLPRRD